MRCLRLLHFGVRVAEIVHCPHAARSDDPGTVTAATASLLAAQQLAPATAAMPQPRSIDARAIGSAGQAPRTGWPPWWRLRR